MRWERLFDDLEAQLGADEQRDLGAEVADRTRRERALLGLHERLSAAVGRGPLELRTAGGVVVTGPAIDVGADWVLVDEHAGRPALIPFAALRSVTGLGRAEQTGAVAKGFGLGAALRAISRDRAVVELVDVERHSVTGTIDGVGRDCVDLAEHPVDLPRRAEHVVAFRTIAFAGLAVVRRR